MSLIDAERVVDSFEGFGAKVGLTPRNYQLEMLEDSMRRNIIVAMDTGSGKTLIAILRIQAELERCAIDKIVWFCAPTVALAEQQFLAISKQLPAYQSRVLSGKDNCEFWTKATWKEVLIGIRIVVSTHAILLDALMHGFVRIDQLSLLVFDEAHKATKNHPSNKIMQKFYHLSPSVHRPSILGLTASPIINNKVHNLHVLEENLDAIARTPKLRRSELLQYVHMPKLVQLIYRPHNIDHTLTSRALVRLRLAYDRYDLNTDPWIVKMKSETDSGWEQSLRKALMQQKT